MPSEPRSFKEFVSESLSRLTGAMAKLREARERKIDLQGLEFKIARGERAKKFLDGSFWKSDLEPFIGEELQKCFMRPWRPGQPFSEDALGSEFFFISGKSAGFEVIAAQMGAWIEEGDAAAKELEEERQRKQAKEDQLARRMS